MSIVGFYRNKYVKNEKKVGHLVLIEINFEMDSQTVRGTGICYNSRLPQAQLIQSGLRI